MGELWGSGGARRLAGCPFSAVAQEAGRGRAAPPPGCPELACSLGLYGLSLHSPGKGWRLQVAACRENEDKQPAPSTLGAAQGRLLGLCGSGGAELVFTFAFLQSFSSPLAVVMCVYGQGARVPSALSIPWLVFTIAWESWLSGPTGAARGFS